jgi:Outer membrane protein beta-barrel domain
VRRINRYLSISFLLLFGIPLAARAQSFDVGMGFGTNHDGSNGGGIDNASSETAFGPCTPGTGDSDCETNPALNNFSLSFGGDFMATKHFGAGFEAVFQPAQENYGPLTYRQTFYDFNAIYAPINEKRVSLKIEGGAGGAKTSVYVPVSVPLGSENELFSENDHFAVHASVGVQIYVTEHIFIRPQFDYRFVPNFTEEFGSDSVTGGSVWIGYSFGDR